MPAKSKARLRDIGEFGLIHTVAKLVRKTKSTIKGIGDDCAVLKSPGGKDLLLTTDMLAEDAHFKASHSARAIGYKAMACSVSDIAAMGGVPRAAVVSLGVPADLKIEFVKNLYRGMNILANKFHFNIVGGDTIVFRKIIINVTLLGVAKKEDIVYRAGAKKGDYIFTTGALGRSFATKKHLSFMPRLGQAQYLVKNFKPTAMIDISDGLAGDLGHILKASKTGAVIYEKLIPKTKGATTKDALYDGEDFELIFTLPPFEGRRFIQTKAQYPFYYIGNIVDKREGFVLLTAEGKREIIPKESFTHF